jgi:GT2 family glycosyltransferase
MENISTPLVSVVVRTCNRPALMLEAVKSVLAQSYGNIEVVLVEDGPAECAPYLDQLVDDGRLTYVPLGRTRGRALAGNEGLARARGDYINFLDDDDLLYPGHVEVLVAALDGRETLAYAGWETVPVQWISQEPLKYRQTAKCRRYLPSFNRFSLFLSNFMAIQSAMFHRSYYEKLGGFDPDLDEHEDWELWCRYSTHGDFLFVPEVTSLTRLRHSRAARRQRMREYEKSIPQARQKIEALPLGLDRFDREAFVGFAERYATSHGHLRTSPGIARILERLRLARRCERVCEDRRPPRGS